jgi:uncharacterized membrane protein HdeD (DUF308 family)
MEKNKIAIVGLNFMCGLTRSTMIVRGILFILLGLAMLICPLGLVRIIVQVTGALLIFNGIGALFAPPHFSPVLRWGYPIITILLGLFALILPGETQWMFLMFIAAWFLLSGGIQLAMLFLPGDNGPAKALSGLSAVINILLGVIFASHPFTGLVAFLWLFASFLIAGGIFTIVLGCCMPQLTASVCGCRNDGDENQSQD